MLKNLMVLSLLYMQNVLMLVIVKLWCLNSFSGSIGIGVCDLCYMNMLSSMILLSLIVYICGLF